MHLVTVNVSSWGSGMEYLKNTRANVVLMQEHKLAASQIDAANNQALALGWTAIWASALITKKGGRSGGFAILARRGIGIHRDSFCTTQPSRLLWGVLEPPGMPRISCCTTYFHTGMGMTGRNLSLLKEIAHQAREAARPGLVAGDFNAEPQAMRATNLLREINGDIFVPANGVATCTAGKRHSIIDYGIFYGGLAECVESAQAELGTNIRTHRPVSFRCHPKLQQLRMRTVKCPPRLPRTSVIGPQWKSTTIEAVHTLAKEAMVRALTGHYDDAVWYRDKAYEAFADAAEKEIAANTGHELKVAGLRARDMTMVWAPLLEKKPKAPIEIPEAIQTHCRTVDAVLDAAERLAGLIAEAEESPAAVTAEMGDNAIDIFKKLHEAIDPESLDSVAVTAHGQRSTDDDRLLAIEGIRCACLVSCIDFLKLLISCEDTPPSGYGALHEAAQERVADIQALADKIHKERGKAIHKEWAGLVRGDGKGATKRAYQASQLPAQWRSEAVPTGSVGDGAYSADPLNVLQAERDKLKELWRGQEEPFEMKPVNPWGGHDPLPRLTPRNIRVASRSFKIQTAETYDGFHVRHFDLLSDECLDALSSILEVSECLLQMPTCNRTVTVGLVPKPKGGHRPIGIFAAIERVWAKARSDIVDEWQRKNERGYFACAKGSGAADVVWNQAVKAEACVADCGSSASILMDLKSFFDTIDLDILLERCHDTGFPMVLAHMAINSYRMPRSVSVRKAAAGLVNATRGILAGHTFALALVQVYYLPVMDAFLARHPHVDVDVYVDDITLTAHGKDDDDVHDRLCAATKDLLQVIHHRLRCSVAPGKTATVASNDALAKRIHATLQDDAGFPTTTAPNLGIDYRAGRRRGKLGKNTCRGGRIWKGQRRRHKIRSLRRLVGPRITARVFASGVLPAMEYGAEVNGVSDKELHTIRTVAGHANASARSGRSLTASLLIRGDPTWRAMVAPVTRWQREIWRAASPAERGCFRDFDDFISRNRDVVGMNDEWEPFTGPGTDELPCGGVWSVGNAGRKHFSLEQLDTMWNKVSSKDHEWYRDDGTPNWARVSGPIAATHLSLERIGWTCNSYCDWTDDMGTRRDLFSMSPKMFRTFLYQSAARWNQRELAQAAGDGSLKGRRACVDVVTAYLAGYQRHMDPQPLLRRWIRGGRRPVPAVPPRRRHHSPPPVALPCPCGRIRSTAAQQRRHHHMCSSGRDWFKPLQLRNFCPPWRRAAAAKQYWHRVDEPQRRSGQAW